MSSKEELARLRVENTRFRDEIQTAKSNEQRLYDENIRLRQDTRRHDTLSITLQEIQVTYLLDFFTCLILIFFLFPGEIREKRSRTNFRDETENRVFE